jgi:tRNA (guanine-N7-)-methyltransferase
MPSFDTPRDYIPDTVRNALHTSRSFVSELQREALEHWLPKWSLPFKFSPLDLGKAFGRQASTILEIGLGMGDTTAELAKARPEDNFLGVEVSDAGVGALLRQIEQESLTNIRIIQHDFLDVVREMIKPGSLSGIHIFFPNSWLKKRHERRALFKKPFVKLLASRIAPGGYLHCSTDWAPYAQHMLKALSAVTQLHNTAAGFSPRPASRPLSPRMSEDRGLQHGEWDLIFKKALV